MCRFSQILFRTFFLETRTSEVTFHSFLNLWCKCTSFLNQSTCQVSRLAISTNSMAFSWKNKLCLHFTWLCILPTTWWTIDECQWQKSVGQLSPSFRFQCDIFDVAKVIASFCFAPLSHKMVCRKERLRRSTLPTKVLAILEMPTLTRPRQSAKSYIHLSVCYSN